jgi:hypothetical protein
MAHSTNNSSNAPQAANTAADEKLMQELNLLRIEGRYFCFDPKEAARRTQQREFTEEIKTFEGIVEKPIRINPHPDFGWPGVLAYKVMHALMKKLSDQAYPFPSSVRVSNKEIARMIGRKSFQGQASAEFFRAIMQLIETSVYCSIYNKANQEWRVTRLQLIDTFEATIEETQEGKTLKDILLVFPDYIVDSLNQRYLTVLNYASLRDLAPIGVALYKHLFFHFSHLVSLQDKQDVRFRKDYETTCEEWLGGLKTRQYKSRIIEQLGQHFKDLKAIDFIRSFEVEKNAAGDGHNLTFYPGRRFFLDYDQAYGDGIQLGLELDAPPQEGSTEGEDVVAYFHRQRLGTDALEQQSFADKELDFARELLNDHPLDRVESFIDFALSKAQQTNYDVQTLVGIRQYRGDFNAYRKEQQKQAEQRERKRQRKKEADRERALEDRYQSLRKTRIEGMRSQLTNEQLKSIKEDCRATISEEHGENLPGFELFVRQKVNSELAQQADVPSFEDWKEGHTGQ